MKRVPPLVAALLAVAACSGHGGQGITGVTTNTVPASVALTPTSLLFHALADTQRIRAVVENSQCDTLADATITWATSDSSVATVSGSGLVTSVGSGRAAITATAGSVAATDSVHVTLPITPASVTLAPTSLSFKTLADTQRIRAVVLNNQGDTLTGVNLTWASTDTSVATVSSKGLVTSVGNGVTTITAAAGTVAGSALARVEYDVPSSITLAPSPLHFQEPQDTQRIRALVTNSHGDSLSNVTISWTSSDTSVATVSAQGVVESVWNGSAVITATAGTVAATDSVYVAVPTTPASLTLTPTSIQFVAELDTQRIHPVVTNSQGDTLRADSLVTWTSSDTAVATVSAAGVVRSIWNGSATITATDGTLTATASVQVALPDGFALAVPDGPIYIVNADGTHMQQLTPDSMQDQYLEPAWAPDGKHLAYAANKVAWEGGSGIYITNNNGTGVRRIYQGLSMYPAWSPDGTKIAFLYITPADSSYGVAVVDTSGANLVKLTSDLCAMCYTDTHPTWSPDGTRIAFDDYLNNDYEIWVMNADGTNKTQIETGGLDPAWSPDGTSIAFAGWHEPYKIYTMNPDGSGVTAVTDSLPTNAYDPAWSPDSKRIAFQQGAGTLVIVNKDGSGLTTVPLTPPYGDGYGFQAPAWRPK